MSDSDPSPTLSALSASLGDLEAALEPLLAKPFDDLLESAKDDPLVQARTQVLASYIVHDLIWVYLKTAGVEPLPHPVMEEIERLKGYFGKLKQAEGGALPPAAPAKPRFQIDRAAANRFISAAIHSAKATVDPSYTPSPGPGVEIDPEAGPSGTHTRFEEDPEVERLLEDKEEDEEEDSDEEVEAMLTGGSGQASDASAKGKEKAKEGTPAKGGKKRAGIDPFAGYDQPKPSTPSAAAGSKKSRKTPSSTTAIASPAPASAASTPQTGSAKRKRQQQEGGGEGGVASPVAGGTPTGELSKKQKKKLKLKGDKERAGRL